MAVVMTEATPPLPGFWRWGFCSVTKGAMAPNFIRAAWWRSDRRRFHILSERQGRRPGARFKVWIHFLFTCAVIAWLLDRRLLTGILIGLACTIKPHFGLLLFWGLLWEGVGVQQRHSGGICAGCRGLGVALRISCSPRLSGGACVSFPSWRKLFCQQLGQWDFERRFILEKQRPVGSVGVSGLPPLSSTRERRLPRSSRWPQSFFCRCSAKRSAQTSSTSAWRRFAPWLARRSRGNTITASFCRSMAWRCNIFLASLSELAAGLILPALPFRGFWLPTSFRLPTF